VYIINVDNICLFSALSADAVRIVRALYAQPSNYRGEGKPVTWGDWFIF
jgi:hypothetical protein